MRRVLCSFLVLASFATGFARADVSYQYTAVPSSTTVQAGSTVTVAVYLTETINSNLSGSNAQNQSIIALDGGLLSGAFFVNTTAGSSATITGLANNVATSANGTNFDSNLKTVFNSTQAAINEATTKSTNFAGAGFSTAAVTSGTVTNSILLGTLTIKGGSTAGTTTYAVESLGNPFNNTRNVPNSLYGGGAPANGNTITAGNNPAWASSYGVGNDLDSTSNVVNGGPPPAYTGAGTNGATGAFTFTITTQAAATPEPSSMLLCGLAVSGMGFGAWRRRKAKLQAEAAPAEEAPLAV